LKYTGETLPYAPYLSSIPVLHVNQPISTMGVALVEQYCLSHKLDLEDAFIAATAIVNDIKLYTLNTKDFIFIPALRNVK
jgi:predicted nucleic acid-binding protein